VIGDIPLVAHRDPDRMVAYRHAAPVTAGRFLAEVRSHAARLPAGGYVMNLCGDRYRFAVALGAALTRGVVTLLPPNLAPQLLQRLAAAYGSTRAFVDPGAAFAGLHPIEVQGCGNDEGTGPVPAFDPGQLAVVAFTSGSTGDALPQPKTWGSLAHGAVAEAAGLQIENLRDATLVGTVPAQHMYGLESTVLLALRNGLALHGTRPLYPADVRAALAEVHGARILVTTPVHLRALLSGGVDLPPLALIVCATAPLPRALAAQAEDRYGAPLREIYGFTEAGMVATRRTALESVWHTLPGVSVRMDGSAALFSGGHVQREAAAGDVVEVHDDKTFVLNGRSSDLVNVAGKRTSLAHLNQALLSIDGVEDGAFFLPDDEEDGTVVRPIAFVVAPRLGREAILTALRERIDPVFLPRPLYPVGTLPRNATGKLPREALAALAQRCAAQASRTEHFVMSQDDPVAQGHFPGNPVVPAALILDEVVRKAERRLALPARAWEVSSAKFLSPLRPGEVLRIDLEVSAEAEVRFACATNDRAVASGILRRAACEPPQ
jgi:acyl-coenzyme A synthetase/AMP-(fatty) acid ligase/3-hydroxymyristoyl/3-hydroxydecanoyl-(acyl carrier protein) dehydratase